jgi:hypothetical protein
LHSVSVVAPIAIHAATLCRSNAGNPKLDTAHRPEDVVLILTRQTTSPNYRFDVLGNCRFYAMNFCALVFLAIKNHTVAGWASERPVPFWERRR